MLNFCQSLPFLNWLFPLHPVPQDFPLHFPQDFLQDCLARFPTAFPTRISCSISHNISCQISLAGSWLVSSPSPIPNAKFPPITALLNKPTYHKSANLFSVLLHIFTFLFTTAYCFYSHLRELVWLWGYISLSLLRVIHPEFLHNSIICLLLKFIFSRYLKRFNQRLVLVSGLCYVK